MRTTDPQSYINVTYTDTSTSSTKASALMWKFGKEIWCNLRGRYMTIVADLSHNAGQAYSLSVCSLAIFGTEYTRATTVPTEVKVIKGRTHSLSVEKIKADSRFPIANTLNIKLRQKAGSEISWVTFIEGTDSTDV